MMKPVKAPFPTDLALFGFLLSNTKKSIKPTIGKKKPKSAKPKLGESFEYSFCVLAPQVVQKAALSSNSRPQFLQYKITPPTNHYITLLLYYFSIILQK